MCSKSKFSYKQMVVKKDGYPEAQNGINGDAGKVFPMLAQNLAGEGGSGDAHQGLPELGLFALPRKILGRGFEGSLGNGHCLSIPCNDHLRMHMPLFDQSFGFSQELSR